MTGDPAVRLVRDGAGRVRLLAADGARAPGQQAGLPAEAAARRHLDRVGATFGVRPRDLRTMSVTRVSGRDVVRFQQTRDGLPVLGGQLVTVLDGQGGLLSVSGETAREAGPAPAYRVEASTAARTARRAVAARHGVPVSTLVAGRPTRWLLDRSLVEPSATPALRSVWRVPVRSRSRLDVADLVLVDARSGRVALRLAEVAGAGPRRLRRPADPSPTGAEPGSTTGSRAVRRPASPTPTRPTTSAAPPRTGTPARSASTSPR